MSKGLENNTSIKDFVTILDKHDNKPKNTNPPQKPKGELSKSTKIKDTNESNKVNKPKTTSKQPPDKNSKTMDLSENAIDKATMQYNSNNVEGDDKHKGVTAKRNASARSPLEGNPGKRQKDTKKIGEMETSTTIMDPCQTESNNITEIPLHTLLEELKEIKTSIQQLNDKLDHELTTRADEYRSLQETITSQHDQITKLNKTNDDLIEQNRKLENEVIKAQTEMLRLKVDFTGINESPYETYEQLRNKIAEVMMPTCSGTNDDIKWKTSIEIPITDCEHLGNYSKNRKRPVRVTFLFMKHKLWLLRQKQLLTPGIYVEESYPEVIQKRRMILRPILKLAKKSIEYKGKCKLDHDTLIIRGIRYKFNTLHLLPEELAPYKSAQISTETTTVFHGLHSPLSNFHTSSFTIDGQHYHTAEQYIQHKKALHFNDYKTAQQILATNDPFEAKTLSRNIERYDKDAWKLVVKEICYPGIRAKFEQNILLKRFLKSTSPTQLGESSYDKLWGTGLPLHDKNATNTSYWSNIGLLGEILMDLRDNNLTKE